MTASIFMATALIVLCAINVIIIIRNIKKSTELDLQSKDLEAISAGIQTRENAVELAEKQLKTSAVASAKCKTVRAFVKTARPQNVRKSLSIQLGYEIFPYCKVDCTDNEDGTKTYYTSINIYPEK